MREIKHDVQKRQIYKYLYSKYLYSYLADIFISYFYIPAYVRKENFNYLSLYLNHLSLPWILITQYSIHIYSSFFCLYNPDRLSPPIRFNHRISVWFFEGENDTSAVRGVFKFRWPPGETKRPYKSFLLRKATHESEYEGLRKKYSTACRAYIRRGASRWNSTRKREPLYIGASSCVGISLIVSFRLIKDQFPTAF